MPSTVAVKKRNFINEHLDAYLQHLVSRNYSRKTVGTYRQAIASLGAFLESKGINQLQNISREHMLDYRLHLREHYQPASIELYLRAAKGLFRYLEARQRLFMNPTDGLIAKQADRKLLPVPSEADIRRLMAQPNAKTPNGVRDRAILETGYGTGARLGELYSLQTNSVNRDDRTLRIMGKGGKERVVPLGESACNWLDRYLQSSRPVLLQGQKTDALWIGSLRQPLGYQSMGILIRRYGKQAGIRVPISAHSLRRACATHMLHNGADPVAIQHLLGHAGMKHLSQYLRVGIRDIKAMHQQSNPGR